MSIQKPVGNSTICIKKIPPKMYTVTILAGIRTNNPTGQVNEFQVPAGGSFTFATTHIIPGSPSIDYFPEYGIYINAWNNFSNFNTTNTHDSTPGLPIEGSTIIVNNDVTYYTTAFTQG